MKQEGGLHEELVSMKTVVKDEPPSVKQDTGLHEEGDKTLVTLVKDELPPSPSSEAEGGEGSRIPAKLRDEDHGEEDDRKVYIPSPSLPCPYEAARIQRIAENKVSHKYKSKGFKN